MAEYLRNVGGISLYGVLRIITASRSSLEDKIAALRLVSDKLTPIVDTLDEEEREHANEIGHLITAATFAINETTENIPAGTVFILSSYLADRLEEYTPCTNFEAARRLLFKHAEINDYEQDLCNYEIEKWIPASDGEMQNTIVWYLGHEGTIWLSEIKSGIDNDLIELAGFYLDGWGNEITTLPVPFRPGDIVTVDCRPHNDICHAVIMELGDNRDCCAVQAIHIDKKWGIRQAALKHDLHNAPMFSCMFRLAKFTGELPKHEAALSIISEAIKLNPSIVNDEDFMEQIYKETGLSKRK